MAFSGAQSHDDTGSNVSDNDITHTIGLANVTAGRVAFAVLATDNVDAGVDTNEHTGVSDTQGNTWTKLKERAWGGTVTSANGGVTVSVWYSMIATTLTSGVDSVTATLSSSRPCRVLGVVSFATDGADINVDDVSTAADSSSTPSVTSGTVSSEERLWIAAMGWEGDGDGFSQDASYSGLLGQSAGNSGNANIIGRLAYRIATITQDTYNPSQSASRDWNVALLALSEVEGDSGDFNDPFTDTLSRAYFIGTRSMEDVSPFGEQLVVLVNDATPSTAYAGGGERDHRFRRIPARVR